MSYSLFAAVVWAIIWLYIVKYWRVENGTFAYMYGFLWAWIAYILAEIVWGVSWKFIGNHAAFWLFCIWTLFSLVWWIVSDISLHESNEPTKEVVYQEKIIYVWTSGVDQKTLLIAKHDTAWDVSGLDTQDDLWEEGALQNTSAAFIVCRSFECSWQWECVLLPDGAACLPPNDQNPWTCLPWFNEIDWLCVEEDALEQEDLSDSTLDNDTQGQRQTTRTRSEGVQVIIEDTASDVLCPSGTCVFRESICVSKPLEATCIEGEFNTAWVCNDGYYEKNGDCIELVTISLADRLWISLADEENNSWLDTPLPTSVADFVGGWWDTSDSFPELRESDGIQEDTSPWTEAIFTQPNTLFEQILHNNRANAPLPEESDTSSVVEMFVTQDKEPNVLERLRSQ